MDIQEAIKILKNHNEWRKGSEEITMSEPKELSKSIDLVIQFAENNQSLQLQQNGVIRSLIKELKIRVKHDYKESTKTEKEFTVFLEFEGEIISESDFTVFL